MFLRRGAKMKSDGWIQPAGKESPLYAGNTPGSLAVRVPEESIPEIDSRESRQ